MIIYVWIFCLIFTGFLLLFGRIRWVETAKRLLSRTKKGMDQSARLRVLENRHKLQELQRNNTWICRVEEFLCYCGMRRRFPACTPEKWIVGNLLGMTVIFGVLLGSSGKFQVDGDLWSVAWEQWEIPDSFIGDNDKRSSGISVPEHAAGRRIADDQ